MEQLLRQFHGLHLLSKDTFEKIEHKKAFLMKWEQLLEWNHRQRSKSRRAAKRNGMVTKAYILARVLVLLQKTKPAARKTRKSTFLSEKIDPLPPRRNLRVQHGRFQELFALGEGNDS